MKKILQIIILSLFAANFGFAQTYTEVQDSLFQHLDKRNIPTGVLYDRVFSWANLHYNYKLRITN